MLTNHTSPRSDDIIADATLEVVRLEGVARPTPRRLALEIGVTPQALINRYGCRDRAIALALRTVVNRWCSDQARRWRVERMLDPDGASTLTALLPEQDDLVDLPAWLTLLTMASADPEHRHLAGRVRQEERAMVSASLLGKEARPGDVDLVLATLDGLHTALAEPDGPLELAQARVVLTRLVEAIGALGAGSTPEAA